MNYLELAHTLDAQDRPVEAAWAYEVAICASNADLDAFLNVVAIYLELQDIGYSAAHSVDMQFVGAAGARIFELLHKAAELFGPQADIEFWRLYTRERLLMEPLPESQYLAIAQSSQSLMPFFPLYVASGGTRYQTEARALAVHSRDKSTVRKRHIMSILESHALPRITE